jgi:hypothetical protein
MPENKNRWIVTRYIKGELVTYIADNWNHVGCLLATEKIVSFEKVA